MIHDATLIERFEDETGHTFDPNGPRLAECPYCDGLTQYAADHDCYGTRGENHDARMTDDRD